jgi:hypothetical protein
MCCCEICGPILQSQNQEIKIMGKGCEGEDKMSTEYNDCTARGSRERVG